VVHALLARGVLDLALLLAVHRDGDLRQNADDDHHDEDLDERETPG